MYHIIISETVQGWVTNLRDASINSGCYVGTFGTYEIALAQAEKKAMQISVDVDGIFVGLI